MKWGQISGSRKRSQKGCRVFVGLVLVLMVSVSVFGVGVPVVNAGNHADEIQPLAYIEMVKASVVSVRLQSENVAVVDWPGSLSCTLDGVGIGTYQVMSSQNSPWSIVGVRFTFSDTSNKWNDGQYHTLSWSGGYVAWSTDTCTVGGGSISVRFADTGGRVALDTYLAPPALSVSIAGPSSVVAGVGGDWSASAAGGTAPYTYAWAYGATGPWGSYPYAGGGFSHNFAIGSWSLGVQVTDATGAHAIDSIAVESGTDVVGYRIELARSGTYGQYITVLVYDHDGLVSPIAHTVGTECGLSDVNGSYGWYANASEAAWVNLYWRWTLSVTVGGAAAPPPEAFYFRSSVHLTNGTELAVTSQFSSLTGVATIYDDDDGTPINPDIPPEPETVLPAWLQALMDSLKRILQWVWEKVVAPALQALFVPSQEQIDQLMPTGSLGATLLEGTSWASGDSSWSMHTHWGTNEIVLVDVDFSDLGAFGTAVKLIVQAGICLSLIYMVVVLL